MENFGLNNNATSDVGDVVKEQDGKTLSEWVRDVLFLKVKFLYDPKKDLAVNGLIFKWYAAGLKEKLIGLKGIANEEHQKAYLESLWTEYAVSKSVVSRGLNSKRCTVYSTMCNRFTGK